MTSPVPATATSSLRALLNTPLRTVFEARLESPTQTWRPSSGSGGATQRVVTLRHNDTVGTALTKLARHRGGLTGASVTIEPDPLRADCMDHGSRVDRDDGYDAAVLLGFFDTGDALRALIDALPDEDRKRATGEIIAPTRNVLAWMKLLEQMQKSVTNRRLVQVLGDDAELLYRPNLRGVTLGEAVREGFLHNKSANGFVHRLAIFDEKGEITRVFSMSDAVRYLALRSDDMGGLEDMTLAELGLGQDTERLVTVDPSVPAIEAFARMCHKSVSGVGVLDKTQGLIANLSASDLRGVTPEHFGMLGLPVAEFLALLHGTSYAGFSHIESQNRSNPFFANAKENAKVLVVAISDDVLGKVLQLVRERGVHRIYVCERGNKPVGVLTLTDILARVALAADPLVSDVVERFA